MLVAAAAANLKPPALLLLFANVYKTIMRHVIGVTETRTPDEPPTSVYIQSIT